jgi:tetratricopeptide (TPR) repeat protein
MFDTFDTGNSKFWDEAEEKAFMAFEMYENGQMNSALNQIGEAIEMNPTNSAWHFNAGLALDTLERFEEAIDAYEQALNLKGDDPEILNCLAVDYTRIGQYDLAISTFEYIQQIEPAFEPCYCNRIITYAEMDQHDKAEHMFYLAQQINPDCPICFYNIGNSLFSQQRYKRAIWCWQRTAHLEPTHPQINYRIAQAYWANGNPQLARTHFLEELRTNPGDTDVILDFGVFLLEHGSIGGAKEKFNRILELDPDFAAALFYLGEIALSRNNHTKAARLFNRALTRNAGFPGPRYRLAQLALTAGDSDQARRLLHEECDLGVDDTDVLLSIGSMLLQLNDLDYATNCFLRVVDEDRSNADAFHYLGVALAKRGEFEGTLQFFEHAVNLGSHDVDILADAAFLYLKTGQLTRAAETIATARILSGDDKEIMRLARKIQLAIITQNFKLHLAHSRFTLTLHLIYARIKCKIRYLIKRQK